MPTSVRNPRITVIIPTRERCDVLRFSLLSAVKQDYDNLEIIVSDNSSHDQTRDVVAAMDDSRIRYINTNQRVSMSANWEFALSHASSSWVTFMGDDDGLPLGAVRRVADIIEATAAQAIRARCATFEWPAATGKGYGRLIVPMGSGFEFRDSAAWLKRTLSGFAKYPELPLVYNGGFIQTSLFERIKARTGLYFGSSSPDVYSAVAIACVVDRYVYCQEPLAISGVSRHSTGASFFSSRETRNAQPAETFSSEGNIPFHPDMPLAGQSIHAVPRSFHALTYEAYLQAQALRQASEQESPARQLEIILAGDTRHRAALYEWGRLFAEHHRLDYEKCLHRAFLRRLVLLPYLYASKALTAMNLIVVDGQHAPLTDVYQASVAVPAIRSSSRRRHSLPLLVRERLKGKG